MLWKLLRITAKIFTYLLSVGGFLLVVIGGIQDTTGGLGILPMTGDQLLVWGGVALAAGIMAAIIRHEWLLHDLDVLVGKPGLRSLYEDGIPPFREYYIRYLRSGDLRVVQRFWESGMVDFPGDTSESPMHAAVHSQNPIIIRGLPERGVNIDCEDQHGYTPLFIAVQQDKKSAARQLLEIGAKMDKRCGRHDATPLFVAIVQGRNELFDLLLSKGANIELTNSDGVTPFICALYGSRWDMAKKLLDKGARPDATKPFGLTSLDIVRNAPEEIKKAIRNSGVEETPNIKITGGGTSGGGRIEIRWEKI